MTDNLDATTWSVQVFPIRRTVRSLLGGKKRTTVGYGWSAHGVPEGYEYDPGPYKSHELAASEARRTLAGRGVLTGDVDSG